MKKIITIIICAYSFLGYSQQEAMFTHYSYNTLSVNPAYAGSRDALTILGLHRSQWVGFSGAPTTQSLTLHSPLFGDQLAGGLTVLNDVIGPISTISLYGDLAYRLKINDKSKLAFGLKGGMNLVQGDIASLEANDETDQFANLNLQSGILPNFGFGMYYSTDKGYVGVSTPKLLQNNLANNNIVLGTEKRHYYIVGGYAFDLKKDKSLMFKPTTLIKMTEGAPLQWDLTGTFVLNEKIEFGVMYRSAAAAGALLGYNLSPQFHFGYSFDWSFVNNTGTHNSGSHELVLRYDLIYPGKNVIKSPRYF